MNDRAKAESQKKDAVANLRESVTRGIQRAIPAAIAQGEPRFVYRTVTDAKK